VLRRSYDQYCAVAKALDVIGERWTLLILRDLVHLGPRRFSDLRDGLPGIGANLLTQRLRRLEREGLIRRRRVAPPGASVVYELTELGAGLEPTIIELGRWGGNFMGDRRRTDVFFPSGHISAIRATFRGEEARGVHASYEFRIDGESFHVEIDEGAVTVALGEAVKPDLVIATDTATSIELMLRQTSPRAAIRSGAVAITGTIEEFERAIDLLAWVPRVEANR
jgi:DNA-binding HxlR family transcriptional regulator/putative sterol carrier protein